MLFTEQLNFVLKHVYFRFSHRLVKVDLIVSDQQYMVKHVFFLYFIMLLYFIVFILCVIVQ